MKNKKRTPFGTRLVDAREGAKLTQMQAAAELEMSQGTLAQAETLGAGSARVVDMARLYNVHPSWLASGDEEAKGLPFPIPRAWRFSAAAMEVAAAFDEQPERTELEREMKRRLHKTWLAFAGRESSPMGEAPKNAKPPRGYQVTLMLEAIPDPGVAAAAESAAAQAILAATHPAGKLTAEGLRASPPGQPAKRTTRRQTPSRAR